jgi:hypothetical protein
LVRAGADGGSHTGLREPLDRAVVAERYQCARRALDALEPVNQAHWHICCYCLPQHYPQQVRSINMGDKTRHHPEAPAGKPSQAEGDRETVEENLREKP